MIYNPKDIVSGDFYWAAHIDNLKIVAAVDCTGHGVPGALMSMIGNTLLNELVKLKRITDPAEILNQLNERIIDELNKGEDYSTFDGMDVAVCVIDEGNLKLEFSGLFTRKASEVLVYVSDVVDSPGFSEVVLLVAEPSADFFLSKRLFAAPLSDIARSSARMDASSSMGFIISSLD